MQHARVRLLMTPGAEDPCLYVKIKKKKSPPLGLEPRTLGTEGLRDIHFATRDLIR